MTSLSSDRNAARLGARHMSLQIICAGVLSCLVLCVYRGVIIDPSETGVSFARSLPAGVAESLSDMLFIASLTVAALALVALVRRSRFACGLVAALFYAVVVVSLA